MSPSISVVIAGKNNASLLTACLDSVLNQGESLHEVIYVNDGSSDATEEMLTRIGARESRLKIIETPGVGISAARNLGNAAASGSFIAVLDSDDEFLPGALARYAQALRSNSPDVIYADCLYVSQRGQVRGARRYPRFRDNRNLRRAILGFPQIPFKHSALLYSRDLFVRVGGYDEGLLQKVDIDLFLRFLDAPGTRVLKLDEVVCKHLKHAGQVSRRRGTGIRVWLGLIRNYEKTAVWKVLLSASRVCAEGAKALVEGFYSA